jgi:flagellar biosynthesis protein FlhF
MKVKRYLASDMQEAMQKIKLELGRDAVILHSRKIKKGGFLGFFSKSLVEVVAAIDEETRKPIETTEKPFTHQIPKKDIEIEALKNQVDAIKDLLHTLLDKVNRSTADDEKNIENPLFRALIENDVNKSVVDRLMEIVARQISMTDQNIPAARNALKVVIKDMLGVPYTIKSEGDGQRIIFFVGPTGVGKTTTLAKLAARLSLLENKKVGFITADTYRIAAVDQLRTYSEILGIPLEVIYEADEMILALKKFKDKELILVDTAGRSHKNENLQADLTELIEKIEKPEIFLVISLTTGYKDIVSILESYQFLGDFKLLFTKLDETNTVGNILNLRVNSNKPISYITNGQSVPDDIEVADIDVLAELMLGDRL